MGVDGCTTRMTREGVVRQGRGPLTLGFSFFCALPFPLPLRSLIRASKLIRASNPHVRPEPHRIGGSCSRKLVEGRHVTRATRIPGPQPSHPCALPPALGPSSHLPQAILIFDL